MILEKNGDCGVILGFSTFFLGFSTFFTGLTTNLSRDVDTAKAHALRMDCVSRQPSFPVIFFRVVNS